MGQGLSGKCTKCGYSFSAHLGVGMMYPIVYEETVKKMKTGELGEEARKFFEEHPDGSIDCENVVVKCTKCGCFDCVQDMTMYIPKANRKNKTDWWSIALSSDDIDDYLSNYEPINEKYADYPHKCPECGESAKIYKTIKEDLVLGKVKCPKCGGPFEEDGATFMWD